mmetsp:Transcript_22258/g.32746  ORF Transcript_22258/g.32746 Transcript_22258/m.32746 type:complete len:442 (+) Transcript_22258:3-1328(+)
MNGVGGTKRTSQSGGVDMGFASNDDPVFTAAERAHELLNKVEDALSSCAESVENDPRGLVSTLEKMRQSVCCSVEDIDNIVVEWNVLSRKHGVSPYILPACHHSLRAELDGNVEARNMLPQAREDERMALLSFEEACQTLTKSRETVARRLSKSVSDRLPMLGMEGWRFDANLGSGSTRACTDPTVYGSGSALGVDVVDFWLLDRHLSDNNLSDQGNGSMEDNKRTTPNTGNEQRHGGKIEVVGSSGEKARILLAIETDLPGSVGASCGSSSSVASMSGSASKSQNSDLSNLDHTTMSPVAVLYDEIDAHVGGRAAVAVAKLLADQTMKSSVKLIDDGIILEGMNGDMSGQRQVLSITHSPSVAAIADRHIVIQREAKTGVERRGHKEYVQILAATVDGLDRRRELARMASGDLASNEAEIFAEALIRDGSLHKKKQQQGP